MCTLLEELRGAGVLHERVVLRPFSPDDIAPRVADTLPRPGRGDRAAQPALDEKDARQPVLLSASSCAPFHQGGFIWFDFCRGGMALGSGGDRKKDYTENVVNLMAERIKSLDPDTQTALKIAASANAFDLKTLARYAASRR